LSNLMTYMDGKTGAEDLVGKMLTDPTLLQTLGSAPNPAASRPAANAESESSEQPDSTTDSETKDPDDGDKGKDDLDSLLDEMK
jgi:hypothetical protein